jgi:N-acetylneuraminic acid mutarotase
MGNILKKAEIYDPETCSWANLPDAPFGLRDAQCMGAGTFAVILGGKKNNDETNFSPLIFNFTTNTWKTGKKTLNLKSRGGICSFENKILWAGGMDSDQAGYMIESRSIQAYDPVTDEWSHFIDMPFSASDCGIVYHNGYLLCAGGTNQESANNKAAVYDIQNAQWTAADDLIAGSGEDSFMFIHSGLFYYGPGIVQVFR